MGNRATGAVSALISHPLANDAAHHLFGLLGIFHVQRRPLVVAEIEFAQIPLQMLLADMVIGARNSTFQDRE